MKIGRGKRPGGVFPACSHHFFLEHLATKFNRVLYISYDMESKDKSTSAFLLEITAKQKKRIERLTQFLTRAEDIVLNAYELDNIPIAQIPELAKTVNKLQKVLYDSLELMRKIVAGNTRVPQSGIDEEIDEIAYLLRTLEPEEFEKLKEGIMEIKPQLRLIRRGKASPGSLDEPGE